MKHCAQATTLLVVIFLWFSVGSTEVQGTDIQLRLVNQSHGFNSGSIVIFQKNVAETDTVIAWHVIKKLGFQEYYSFTYPPNFTVSVGDAQGNYTPDSPATVGQRWEMTRDSTGNVLKLTDTPAQSPEEIEVFNTLGRDALSARIYRDGKLLALKTNVKPGQKVVFKFLPEIFVGVVPDPEIQEGDVLDSEIIPDITTKFNLLGIRKADIIMTDSGGGPDAPKFRFEIANIGRL